MKTWGSAQEFNINFCEFEQSLQHRAGLPPGLLAGERCLEGLNSMCEKIGNIWHLKSFLFNSSNLPIILCYFNFALLVIYSNVKYLSCLKWLICTLLFYVSQLHVILKKHNGNKSKKDQSWTEIRSVCLHPFRAASVLVLSGYFASSVKRFADTTERRDGVTLYIIHLLLITLLKGRAATQYSRWL